MRVSLHIDGLRRMTSATRALTVASHSPATSTSAATRRQPCREWPCRGPGQQWGKRWQIAPRPAWPGAHGPLAQLTLSMTPRCPGTVTRLRRLCLSLGCFDARDAGDGISRHACPAVDHAASPTLTISRVSCLIPA